MARHPDTLQVKRIARRPNRRSVDRKGSRPKVEVSVCKINPNARGKYSPATIIAPVRINESSKAEGKHPGQGPEPAVRVGREKRD